MRISCFAFLCNLCAVITCMLLQSCTSVNWESSLNENAIKESAKCTGNEFDIFLSGDPKFVLFGEIHGTNQAPEAVTRFICELLDKKKSVRLFLERDVSEEKSIDSYLVSSGSSSDKCLLFEKNAWSSKKQDGRSSNAIFKLIDYVRFRKKLGADIKIVPFSMSDDEQEAKLIRKEINGDPSRFSVMLVGNVHASKSLISFSTKEFFYPLNSYLQDLNSVSLNMTAPGGEYWACVGSKKCGLQLYPEIIDSRKNETLKLELTKVDDLTFDGTFFVGKITASGPAANNTCDFGNLGD